MHPGPGDAPDSRPATPRSDPWDARLDLRFGAAGARGTVLKERRHDGPLRVQKALYPEGPRVCHLAIVHPPGGIVAGDRLAITLNAEADAHALITTPGATKWYKAQGLTALQEVRIAAGADAVVEWLPQESIVFDRADCASRMDVDLGPGALFLGWEVLCFGRTASGESFRSGRYRQRWRIAQQGTLLWNETGTLEGGGALMASPIGLGGWPVCATLVAAGRPVSAALLEAVRERVASLPCAGRVGATRLPSLMVVRYAGASTEEARAAFAAIWAILRPDLVGIAAEAPRLWAT
ncbi:MAG: urease accessory protein UreD [Burkholderiales bacterium]|nr:urease accessory protein UreD [Burkholderiales bacterium]